MQRLCAAAGHKTAAQPGAAWRSPLPWAPSTLPPPALTAAGGARAANDRLLRLSSRLRRGGELTAQADNDGEVLSKIEEILKKYDDNGQALSRRQAPAPASTPAPAPAPATAGNGGMGNGLFAILAINGLMYAGANLMHLPALGSLALDHWAPRWWQFVTATFVHANWQHLSGNAFALLVFGRMVEEEEGWLGVWLTYLLAGVGGTMASYLTAPHTHTISLGASGAVFGLFMVSIISKLKPSLKRLLECVILGQYVVQQVLGEFHMVAAAAVGKGAAAASGGMQVGHVAHLAGASVGVLLVLLISRLPEKDA